MRIAATILLILAMLFCGLVLAASLAGFYAGSLESFPNEEQLEKARISYALLAGGSILMELIFGASLYRLLKRLRIFAHLI